MMDGASCVDILHIYYIYEQSLYKRLAHGILPRYIGKYCHLIAILLRLAYIFVWRLTVNFTGAILINSGKAAEKAAFCRPKITKRKEVLVFTGKGTVCRGGNITQPDKMPKYRRFAQNTNAIIKRNGKNVRNKAAS
jgi:hypothetical protein